MVHFSHSCSIRRLWHRSRTLNNTPVQHNHVHSENPDEAKALSPMVIAVIFGLVSAVGYTAANVCLRSVTHVNPIWVSCMKSVPTVLLAVPFVVWRRWSGHHVFPSYRILLLTIAMALLGQLGGNISFQYALGKIGIALDVPLTLGTMIVVSAILGWWLLGDSISLQMAMAGTMLIFAMFVLGLGADEANQVIDESTTTRFAESNGMPDAVAVSSDVDASVARALVKWNTFLGISAACFSGFAYCCLSLTIRYSTRSGALPSSLVAIVGVAGLISLGGLTLLREGTAPMTSASWSDYGYMIGAGLFNYFAFITLTKALQLSSVFFVNALNASQTAMAAVAGIVIFGEPSTTALHAGIFLTVVGLLMMTKRKTTRSIKDSQSP